MFRHTSMTPGDHFAGFVDRQVAQGRYGSAGDVVLTGLRLLEEREFKVDALHAALGEGEASDEPRPLDIKDFLQVRCAGVKIQAATPAAPAAICRSN